jgi:uncharacterized membrane protein YkvA (DUF1232 family)
MEMKNRYFNRAVDQARDLFGNKDKLMKTIDKAFRKITEIEDEKGTLKGMVDKVKLFLRMIRAYAEGEYREVPWKTMLLILASILYFLNPFDLIPDFIPGIGLIDDISILLWVFSSVEKDIDKFQENFYGSRQ